MGLFSFINQESIYLSYSKAWADGSVGEVQRTVSYNSLPRSMIQNN